MSFNQLFRKSATSRMNLHAKSQILENRLSIATGYLEKIAEGNFTLDLRHDDHLQDDAAASFNNTLIRLRDKLLQYAEKDQQRLWAAEGLSKFMNLIKGDTHAQTNFYDKILSFLINYLNANQGGIFLLNDADPQAVYLELTACYAYSKKKYLDKVLLGNASSRKRRPSLPISQRITSRLHQALENQRPPSYLSFRLNLTMTY
jgi:hypothetical protein